MISPPFQYKVRFLLSLYYISIMIYLYFTKIIIANEYSIHEWVHRLGWFKFYGALSPLFHNLPIHQSKSSASSLGYTISFSLVVSIVNPLELKLHLQKEFNLGLIIYFLKSNFHLLIAIIRDLLSTAVNIIYVCLPSC